MQVEYNTRSSGNQNYVEGKAQDGRKDNAQNLSQEDRAKGGRNSAKNRGNQGQRHYGHDHDNEDYGDDNQNYKGGNKPKRQDGRRNNGQNLTHEDRVRGGKNSRKNSDDGTQYFGTSKIKSPKSQDGRRNNGQNLSQEDTARGGRNSNKGQGSYGSMNYSEPGSRELEELLEDATHFLEQPIPDKVADNLHYEDGEIDDSVSGSEIDEMLDGEPDPDQAEMDGQKKTYFTEYGGKNRNRGQKQGHRQYGRRNNGQNLNQEDRVRGGKNSGKNRGNQKQGDYDNDNEDDYDDEDNQNYKGGNKPKSQDGRRNNGQNLTHEDRVRGGKNSGKNRGGQRQENYDNEDEDEGDYDDNQNRSKGQDGRRNNAQNLSHEDRVKGGKNSGKKYGNHNASGKRQANNDNDYGDEDEHPVQKKRQTQQGKTY